MLRRTRSLTGTCRASSRTSSWTRSCSTPCACRRRIKSSTAGAPAGGCRERGGRRCEPWLGTCAPPLPTLGQCSTAAQSLLNEERDPFNRAYLTADMLIPMPLLRTAIRAWLAATKRGDAASAAQQLAAAKRLIAEEGNAPEAPSPAEAAGPVAPQSPSAASVPPAAAPATPAAMEDADDELMEALRMSMEQ